MEVLNDPIPHIIARLDERVYEYCKSKWISGENTNHELRYNVQIEDVLIKSYVKNVTSEAYKLLFKYLKEAYPKWNVYQTTIREQFSGNLKSDQAYQMRDWHLDNGNKILIGLWYFKHSDDSDEGGLYISNGKVKKLIPYQENTVVFLPNLPNAWHKVADRSVWTHERQFINIVVEQKEFLHDYRRDEDGVDRIRPVRNLMI